MVDAKVAMGIFRLHKNDWERASKTISQTRIRYPEPRDIWHLDGESNTTSKRSELAKRFGIDIPTRKRSSVCMIPVLIMQESFIMIVL